MTEWLKISSVDGRNLGWVKASQVVRVHGGSGQRLIEFLDNGVARTACRHYDFDDDEFMRRLGLPSEG